MNLKQEAIETIKFFKENWKDLIAALSLVVGGYLWIILIYAITG